MILSITLDRKKGGIASSLISYSKALDLIGEKQNATSEYVLPKSGSIDYASRVNKSFVNIHKNWGTGSSNVHHINFAAPTSSYGTFNTYDIETKFVFHAIGDNEYYSASMGTGSSQFEDTSRFYNQLVITDGPAGLVTNQPLYVKANVTLSHTAHVAQRGLDAPVSLSGEVVGKRMGKTRFMRLVSGFNGISNNRQLILPNNHVLRFSQPFKEQMIKGAQNTNPGFLPVQKEDYSTASFYRVDVTGGENKIRVGMNISNFGGKLGMEGINTLVDIDIDETIYGNNDRIDGYLDASKWPLPLIFRFGLSREFLANDYFKFLLSVDAIHPNNNPEYLNVGAEISAMDLLFLRLGKSHFLYRQKFVEDGSSVIIEHEQGFSLGAGLKYQIPRGPMLIVDYVLMNYGVFKNISGYSVKLSF